MAFAAAALKHDGEQLSQPLAGGEVAGRWKTEPDEPRHIMRKDEFIQPGFS